MLEEILEMYPDESFLKLDGFDDAIIGVDEINYKLIYSKNKIIKIMIDRDEMTHEEALDYYGFNVVRSIPYQGSEAPILCDDEF